MIAVDLPFEITSSVFSMLGIEELEALSRTSKALREILLTRETGLVIYRRVFARLFAAGLPVPPPRLSLPTYASLLCLKTCSVRTIDGPISAHARRLAARFAAAAIARRSASRGASAGPRN